MFVLGFLLHFNTVLLYGSLIICVTSCSYFTSHSIHSSSPNGSIVDLYAPETPQICVVCTVIHPYSRLAGTTT